MRRAKKFTFYLAGEHVHAYEGCYNDSIRKKTYISRVGKSIFIVPKTDDSEYIFKLSRLVQYLNENLSNTNEIIISNVSRANVGCILNLCNENRNNNVKDETENSESRIVEFANSLLIELFDISYEEFIKLPCLEQNKLMEQVYIKKDSNNEKKVMIGSGEHSIFVTRQKGEKVMLDDGTFVRVGDNPYQSRKRIDEKLDDMVKEEKSFVRKLFKKNDRK